MSRHNPELTEVSGGSYARQTTTWMGANTNPNDAPTFHGLNVVPTPAARTGDFIVLDGGQAKIMVWDGGRWVEAALSPTSATVARDPEPSADEVRVLSRRAARRAKRESARERPRVDLHPKEIER